MGWGRPAGPLDKMRESAVHAVEGVKMRLHLAGAAEGHGQPTAEERTGGRMGQLDGGPQLFLRISYPADMRFHFAGQWRARHHTK